MISGIDATYYLCKDLARGTAFYRDALGLKAEHEFDGGIEFGLPDGNAFGLTKLPGDEWIQSGGVMFAVDDIAATTDRVLAGGGSVLMGVMETPVCHMAWCADTEGNSFALHRRKA